MRKSCIHFLAMFCLPLLMVSNSAKGQTLPPPSDPGYQAAKAAALLAAPSAPMSPLAPYSPSTLVWADGCFINPDESYSTLAANDDGSTGLISLPFTFRLYGTDYTSCHINNNGNITFTGSFSGFTPSGFPLAGRPMVAGYWTDVDTRPNPGVCTSALLHYKVDAHRLTATWPGVGYFSLGCTLLDSFQIIITDGTDPEIGIGNNVAFRYGQMNWATTGGFGGAAATVGVNAGDGVNYVQVGRFNSDGATYVDNVTPGGVRYLEYNCFALTAADTGNLPPSVSGMPSGGTETISCGTTRSYFINWIGPEVGQLTSSTVTYLGSSCGVTIADPSGFFSVSRDTITIVGSPCNIGTHTFALQGTDNLGGISNDTFTVVVTALSVTASNSGPVCAGNTLNLSCSSGGAGATYSWAGPGGFSSTMQNPSITGATSAATGTYTVSVTNGSCTATATTSATITTTAITGTPSVCVGSTTTLSAGTGGGSWISGSTGVATVVSGVVTGVSAGTALISYYNAGCLSTVTVTVNAIPSITTEGSVYICPAATYTLTASMSGGTWGSSDVAAATVGMTSGIVTGVATGSTSISYTVAGCVSAPFLVGVLPATEAPSAIEGESVLCVGSYISLSSATEAGSWSSSNTSVATVEGGMVYGVSGGTAAITYSVTGDCGTAYDAHIVTVISSPAPISGPASVCVGSTITLTSSPAGGTWSTSTMLEVGPSIAISDVLSVDESTGVVTGVTAGTAYVTYTAPSGCSVSTVITVEELPASITGTTSVCVGSTTTLSSATAGGSWTSSNTSRATVDAGTGVVSGVATGTVSISYTLSSGCRRKTTVTVIATPSSITGSLTLCSGSTATLSSATTGGSWSSSNGDAATIDASTGVVTGVGAGTSTIMYTIGGCSVSAVVTVSGTVSANTGNALICIGQSSTLSNATSGGTWSSSNASVATVSASTGLVTAVSTGVANITYMASAGCFAITEVTINVAVSDITGTTSVCPGLTTTLSNATSGGSWSSSNETRATVDAGTGVVTGVSGGSVTISYIVSAGCSKSTVVTVLSSPASIGGTASVCEGSTTTLTCSPGGGTWSSSGSEATVGSTGIVTGVSAGTVTIFYTSGAGCASARIVTVSATPTSITGTLGICVGGTATLSSTPSGGTWVVANVTKATVGSSTGVITGVAVGSTAITYTAGGCRTISAVTVSATPSAIGGTQTVCVGSTTTLTSATTGGTWTSGDGAIATVVAGTGVVTGVSAGTVVISYSNGTCERTAIVTVNAALGANTGSSTVCVGSSTTLSNATTGGTWSSSSTGVATVNTTTGVVVGVSAGTTNISYRLGAGCFSVTEVTVTPALSSITGTASVCPGATTTLSHADAGGAWSSNNLAKATVDAGTGVVTGVSAGTVFITYTLGGCTTSTTVTVNTPPAAITGTASVCVGATTNLASTTSGGTWTSSDGGVATVVSGTGVVTGVGAGTATISYQTGSGCVATYEVTVTAAPGSISGTLSACIGTTTTLSNATSGGTWSSSNPAKATVVSGTGVVTGVSAGTSIITYATSSTCRVTAVVTISAAPSSIAGTLTVCDVCTTTLSTAVSGGVWSSSDGAVATVVSGTGVVSGVSIGTATISYVVSGCTVTAVVTVTPSTSPSTGTPVVCVGQTNSTLSNPVPDGTWSSSDPSIATVHAVTGILTGVSVGNANITYTTSPGIYTIIVATVSAATAMNAGTFSICPLTTTTLTNATGGGTWASSNNLIATVVSGTGVVSGVATGTVNISYIVNVGCYRVSAVTIKSQPNISGTATTVPVLGIRNLTVSPGGGSWTSANAAIASVTTTAGTFAGRVTGVSIGATTLTYTIPTTGCFRTRAMTVTPSRPGAPVVSEAAQSGVLTVFPNPTSGVITVDAPEAGTFTVYTIDGREVAQYAVIASANVVTLPSNLAAGIYMCRFMSEDGASTIVRLVYEQK